MSELDFESLRDKLATGELTAIEQMTFDNLLHDRLAALAGAAPVAFPRVETGVVQFGDDWPGVFIRGDNAFATAMHLRGEDVVWRNAAVKAMAELLESCNVANKPDVRIIPTPHAPAKAREDVGNG